jgi:hypothetical protein
MLFGHHFLSCISIFLNELFEGIIIGYGMKLSCILFFFLSVLFPLFVINLLYWLHELCFLLHTLKVIIIQDKQLAFMMLIAWSFCLPRKSHPIFLPKIRYDILHQNLLLIFLEHFSLLIVFSYSNIEISRGVTSSFLSAGQSTL